MSTSVTCTTLQSIDNSNNCQEEMVQSENLISFALKNLRKNLFNSVNERKKLSLAEVSNHDMFDDCWIVLYDRVYDVTKFLNEVNI